MSYHDNVATIAKHEDDVLDLYLDTRYHVDHDETHLCNLCMDKLISIEEDYCEECK